MKLGILGELMKNLFRKAMTVRFPKEAKAISDGYRGEQSFDKSKCRSCGLCARVCPNKAIEMVGVKEGGGVRRYPKIDMGKCCFCGLCQDVCPTGAIKMTKSLPESTPDPSSLVKNPNTG